MANGILVFCEVRDGAVKAVSRELITAAGELSAAGGGPVSAAIVGDGIDGAVEEACTYGAEKLYVAKGTPFASYSTQAFALALEAIINESGAAIVLFPATSLGRDLSARVAAKCDASLFVDCTEVSLVDGKLGVKRPVYSGKVYVELVATADVQLASVRPNIYPAAQGGGSAEVVEVSVAVDDSAIGGRVREILTAATGRKDVSEAEVIVAGGRAMKSDENFRLLEELADVLGASVGASRAAVDAGYAPHSMQIGQTGKVVNPKLYIACGISGAIQHLVGMRTSKVIVSINKDENAPIFQRSDYGIVGDLFEVVPLLTGAFKEKLGG